MIRKTFRIIFCILFVSSILAACTKPTEMVTLSPPMDTQLPPTPTLEPSPTTTSAREPISAAEVKRIASDVEIMTNAKVEAWNTGDFEAIQALFTDDIVFTNATLGDHLVGMDEFMGMARAFVHYNPSLRRQVTNHFIGLEDSLATYDYWDFTLEDYYFTQDDPFLWVHLSQTRGDRYSSWTLLEGIETIEKSGWYIDKGRLDEARSLLSTYGSAWSSRDQGIVGKLYTDSVVRVDTIFGESQAGSEAVSSFAKSFFAWYPGVKWNLQQSFGEWRGESPLIGGTYAVEVTDSTNQPCDVLVAVLLKASEGKITHEALYYEPDSLIKCGWVK